VKQPYPALVTTLVETCLCCRTGILAPAPRVSDCAGTAHTARPMSKLTGRSRPGRGVGASRNASQLQARGGPAGSPETLSPAIRSSHDFDIAGSAVRYWKRTEGVTTTALAPRTRADTKAGLGTVDDVRLASRQLRGSPSRRAPDAIADRADVPAFPRPRVRATDRRGTYPRPRFDTARGVLAANDRALLVANSETLHARAGTIMRDHGAPLRRGRVERPRGGRGSNGEAVVRFASISVGLRSLGHSREVACRHTAPPRLSRA
jgi:hypothetical protein